MTTFQTKSNHEAAEIALRIMGEHGEGRIALFSSELAVVYGSPQYVNIPACIRRGIFMFPAAHLAGAIVCFPGDLSIMELRYGHGSFGSDAIKTAERLVKTHSEHALIDGNDLLVDGKKIASWADISLSGYYQSVVHFSVHSDVDLIRELCKKPMVKTPGALSDYGITAADIMTALGRS